jgi:RNA polymerase sigma-70 factor (ECF subfamily)
MSGSSQQVADEWLVLQSQDGDARAFDLLVSRWQERLWRHARRLVRDDAAAWDVLQEAWMSMLKNLRRLEDPRAFSPWAYRIVTLRSMDHLRRGKRQKRLVEEQRRACTPQQTNEVDDDVEELRLALDELSFEQRAIISLHYKEELGVERISEILDIPAGTVKSRLHRARAALKERLERRRR